MLIKYRLIINMHYCSPSKNNRLHNTCYDYDDLKAIAKAYNNVVKQKENICINDTKTPVCTTASKLINTKLNSDELYNELSERFSVICSSDMKWTDLDFIQNIKDKNLKNSILYFTFKPKPTKTVNTWFNTHNINEIMQQYQDLYKDTFVFLGAQPSDFSKITKIKWKKLKKINNIGIIFNTHNHLQPGQHWLSVFIDNVNKKVDYFDSLGKMPNKNIASFLKHFSPKNYTFTINKTEHQKGNVLCGVYSCYFIIQRLKGLSFQQITNEIITDKMMADYRLLLFRPH